MVGAEGFEPPTNGVYKLAARASAALSYLTAYMLSVCTRFRNQKVPSRRSRIV